MQGEAKMGREHYPGENPKERKLEFIKKLKSLTREKGWNKSELARRAGISRDRVSVYTRINKLTLPSVENLNKVANALEILPAELIPEVFMSDNYGLLKTFSIKDVTDKEGIVLLQINREVPKKKALQVALLLEE